MQCLSVASRGRIERKEKRERDSSLIPGSFPSSFHSFRLLCVCASRCTSSSASPSLHSFTLLFLSSPSLTHVQTLSACFPSHVIPGSGAGKRMLLPPSSTTTRDAGIFGLCPRRPHTTTRSPPSSCHPSLVSPFPSIRPYTSHPVLTLHALEFPHSLTLSPSVLSLLPSSDNYCTDSLQHLVIIPCSLLSLSPFYSPGDPAFFTHTSNTQAERESAQSLPRVSLSRLSPHLSPGLLPPHSQDRLSRRHTHRKISCSTRVTPAHHRLICVSCARVRLCLPCIPAKTAPTVETRNKKKKRTDCSGVTTCTSFHAFVVISTSARHTHRETPESVRESVVATDHHHDDDPRPTTRTYRVSPSIPSSPSTT